MVSEYVKVEVINHINVVDNVVVEDGVPESVVVKKRIVPKLFPTKDNIIYRKVGSNVNIHGPPKVTYKTILPRRGFYD